MCEQWMTERVRHSNGRSEWVAYVWLAGIEWAESVYVEWCTESLCPATKHTHTHRDTQRHTHTHQDRQTDTQTHRQLRVVQDERTSWLCQQWFNDDVDKVLSDQWSQSTSIRADDNHMLRVLWHSNCEVELNKMMLSLRLLNLSHTHTH